MISPKHARVHRRVVAEPYDVLRPFTSPIYEYTALEKEEDMNRRSVLTKSVPIVLAAALLPSNVAAQQKSIKSCPCLSQVFGTRA